ncbi:TrkA C-terminal domain-containing protein [Natronomonas salsuginis]|uniref:Potassium transporter TrkA n=1 Tax=Natronomonas salsuginis TaxID=2217661 RepID=A0A4U5JCH6_9EURY|nr:TrkA C-terminal domain-containing protein [Natronomonas salsuginis]TKR25991.1 potassium transporter TrkA [Natronomonas salsuginis]
MSLAGGQLALVDQLLIDVARVTVLVVTAVATGIVAGFVHRWYAGTRVPDGLSVLVGLSVVALYLNTAGALGEVIGGQVELLAVETAIFNTVTFLLAGVAAVGGGRLGDRLGVGVFAVSGAKSLDSDVSRIVRTVGRVTTVQLPAEIADIDGYDPVDAATKEKLADQTLVFPRRLTLEELRTRFVDRLQTDYGVGHVDVDFAEDATIEYLALGGRESGIGPTLPPGSAALAVRADPPNNASPGDLVQVWTSSDAGSSPSSAPDADAGTDTTADANSKPQRVTNAEIRGTAGDIVTLAVDELDANRLDTDRRYRLVTLPVEARADREFASQLRTAEETMRAVTIGEGSALVGDPIGALDVAIVAVGTADGEIAAIPTRHREIGVGDTLYAIGRPDRLRKVETAANATAGPDVHARSGDGPL